MTLTWPRAAPPLPHTWTGAETPPACSCTCVLWEFLTVANEKTLKILFFKFEIFADVFVDLTDEVLEFKEWTCTDRHSVINDI